MKKKFSTFVIILLPLLLFTFLIFRFNYKDNNSTSSKAIAASAKPTNIFENFDQLISNSPFIIEGVPTEKQEEITYGGVTFVTSQIKIKNVLKRNFNTDKYITLLQTKIEEDPLVKKNEHVLLFIEKYSGPIINDAYVCKGLYQGHYDVDSKGNLVASHSQSSSNKLSDSLKNIKNLKGINEKIKLINSSNIQ